MMRYLGTTVLVLSLFVSVVGLASQSADAQTMRLRLWSTPRGTSIIGEPNGGTAGGIDTLGGLDSLAPGNIVWDSTLLGLEVRTRPSARFLFSGAFDTGPMANLIDGEGGFGASRTPFWARWTRRTAQRR